MKIPCVNSYRKLDQDLKLYCLEQRIWHLEAQTKFLVILIFYLIG